ncbi:MAG: shikimate dehydrogenase [Alicyclobacillaceae bacterium]|nr:shikimate dehydrogenase [Alicyclobacillaceae bacterium]
MRKGRGWGVTRIEGHVALIGHPVGHSLSPAMHNRAFEYLGIPWQYSAFDVRREDLDSAMRGLQVLGFRGWNVTIPHKEAACRLVDELSEEAAEIGAVNTVAVQEGRLVGYNTDGWGYVQSLRQEANLDPEGKICAVMGAGGASRGIVYALARVGAEVWVFSRRPEQAEQLAASMGGKGPGRVYAMDWERRPELLGKVDLCVNTTPVGMAPHVDAVPFDPRWTRESCVISDIVYNPRETALLKIARQLGRPTHDGVGMFVFQGAAAFRIWTGRPAPVREMRRRVEELLDLREAQGGADA